MKPFKIKVLLTYVFYVTTVIMRNMCRQLLTFQNGVFSQDSFCSINTRFYQKSSFWNDIKVIIKNKSSKNGDANQFGSSNNLERLVNLFIYIAL